MSEPAIFLVDTWCRNSSSRKARSTCNMADGGGGAVQEEIGRDMVEGQRKMSEPAQPVNNHQAQKSEASKKSLKKKGGSLKSAQVFSMIFLCVNV